VGYTLSGSEDFSGNYTISGTYNEGPAWQHETKNYLMYFVSESTGWAAFPGTIAGGPSAGPLTFQACGYPCGGGGTCTVGAIIGDYCGQGDYDGYTFTITQAGGATTTAAPTTTTTAAPSVPAYFVATNAAYGGKYCEDGTFDGKPKYRKAGTNYYIYWVVADYGWGVSDDLGNISPPAIAPNVGGDTPPTGSSAFFDYNTGSDLGNYNAFYSMSSPITLSNTLAYFGNTYNGKPKYNSFGGGLLAQYDSQQGVWAIIDEEMDPGNPIVLYTNSSNSNTLPLTGWVVADGNSPAPTLIGPTCGG
jgi:hypothetical protein